MKRRVFSTRGGESHDSLVTVSGAGRLLSISERSVWRLIQKGELDVVRLGRSVRVSAQAIEKLIRRGGAR